MILKSLIMRAVIILIFGFLLQCPSQLIGQTKRALIVGISDYPAYTDWEDLHSFNDVNLLTSVLRVEGFDSINIAIIKDDQATKSGIMSAIEKFKNSLNSGDIALFHFSGHGQQKTDSNGDEIDGLDECIVSFDSPKKYKKGIYSGENLITDDELGIAIYDWRNKLGKAGQLIVTIDACHSGSATRGMSNLTARGTELKMMEREDIKHNVDSKLEREINQTESNEQVHSGDKLASLIAFFGSAQHQLNYEFDDENGDSRGVLSYTFAKGIQNLKRGESYRDLFEYIKFEMNKISPSQEPQAEGDLDVEVFFGNIVDRKDEIQVKGYNENGNLVLYAGTLQGLYSGTKLGFFKKFDSTLVDSPLFFGIVESVKANLSVIKTDHVISIDSINFFKARIIEKSYPSTKLSLQIKSNIPQLTSQLQKEFSKISWITIDDLSPQFIIEAENTLVKIKTKEGILVEEFSHKMSEEFYFNRIIQILSKLFQTGILLQLKAYNPNISLDFEILQDGSNSIKPDKSGNMRLKVGSKIKFKIINKSAQRLYYNLVDIQPNHLHAVILPQFPYTAKETSIGPYEELIIPILFDIAPPLGAELFKLITATEAFDLRLSNTTRGLATITSFDQILKKCGFESNDMTRAASESQTSIDDVHIQSKIYYIVE